MNLDIFQLNSIFVFYITDLLHFLWYEWVLKLIFYHNFAGDLFVFLPLESFTLLINKFKSENLPYCLKENSAFVLTRKETILTSSHTEYAKLKSALQLI